MKHDYKVVVDIDLLRDHLAAAHKLDTSYVSPAALRIVHAVEHNIHIPGVDMPHGREYYDLFAPRLPTPWYKELCTGRGDHYGDFKILSQPESSLVLIVRRESLADRIIDAVNWYEKETHLP